MRTTLIFLLVLFAVQAHGSNDNTGTELLPPCVSGSPTTINGSRCGPGTVTIGVVSVPSGFFLKLFDATGTNALLTTDGGLTFDTPSISTTTNFMVAYWRPSDNCTSIKSSVTATVNPPLSVNAGADQTGASMCGITSTTISASPTSGTWSIISGNGGSIGSTSSSTTTFSGIAGNSYTLRWAAGSGNCVGSDDVVIVFGQNPSLPIAGPDQIACVSASLSGNTPSVGTGSWSIAVDSNPGGTITATGSTTGTLSGNAGMYVVDWTITNGACKLTDEATITLQRPPTVSNAGADLSGICGVTTVALSANNPTSGTGSWTMISGSDGSFGNTASPSSNFSGAPGSTYTLRWTISNTCGSSTDDMIVAFNANPTVANAGPDQNGAITCGLTSVTLAANHAEVGVGSWSIVSGAGGSVAIPSSATSTFTGTPGTNYVLRWSISNSPCATSTDEVNITLTPRPNVGVSPATQTICSGGTATINITNPNGVAGTAFKWSKVINNANPPDVTSPGSSISGVYTNGDDVNQGSVTYAIIPYITGCQGTTVTAKVIVKDVPTNPNPGPQLTYGDTALLKFEILVPDSVEAKWFPDSFGASFHTGPNFTNSTVTDPSTYYISFRQTASGCETARYAITSTRVSLIPVSRVITETVRVPGKVTANDIYALSDLTQKTVGYAYLDGLGRTVQAVVAKQAQSGNDLVQPVTYDAYGRTSRRYLPYTDANVNAYQTTFKTKQAAFYKASDDKIANDSIPYDSTRYEASPLGRLLEQGRVGKAWQPGTGHTIGVKYSFNVLGDSVHVFTCDPLTAVTSSGKYYAANMLTRTETTNENGNKTIMFADAAGRTILKRQQLDGTINGASVPFLDTYYVYDVFNSLRYIVPPGGVQAVKSAGWGVVNSTILGQHIYQFAYDNRGRLIKEKTPGKDWTFFGYDKMDRPVLVQDANIRSQNKWAFLKYDRHGRVVMTGFYLNSTQTTQSAVQGILDSQYSSGLWYETRGTTMMGYSNQSFPTQNADASPVEVMTVNYFDDYDFDFNGTADYTYDNSQLSGLPASSGSYTRGRVTGSYVKVLGTVSRFLKNVVFYDNFGRPIQSMGNNYLNATVADKESMVYDFEDKVTVAKNYHDGGGSNQVTTLLTPGYDVSGRANLIQHSINGASNTTLVKYEYNDLGQIVMKRLHNTGGLNYMQNVDYRYNIRGWLTAINNAGRTNDGNATNGDTNDFFGMEVLYNVTDAGVGNTAAFNGNISSVKWKGVEGLSGTEDQKNYNFSYDKTNRLTSALFKQSNSVGWTVDAHALDESMTYDHNGNVLTLQRKRKNSSSGSVETVDNLAYTYANGNLLSKVDDSSGITDGFSDGANATTEYTYDLASNLTADNNKNISSIVYNVLGKPQQINFSDGRTVAYKYDANGVKLKMEVAASGHIDSTNYVNGYVYANGALDFFGVPEGRVKKNGSSYEYQYNIADHQGNTRILFTSAPAQKVTATFETPAQGTEAGQFLNYPSGSGINPVSSNNHTSGGSKSQVLNGGYMGLVGVAQSYAVLPGDTVRIEAYARYDVHSGASNVSTFATSLLAAFSLPAPGPGETGTASSAINSHGIIAAGGWGDGSTDSSHPKAFVNILIFDKNYNFLDVAYAQVTSTGSPGYLNASYAIKQTGYAYVYISNEDPTLTDVYFDDVSMTLASPVVQSNEYYPFGLMTSNSWTRGNNKNNFLYNEGSELNTTSGLYDLPYRNYDAALGRFFQVDPLAIYDHSISPFAYARNSPAVYNDPSGLMLPMGWSDAQAKALYNKVSTSYSGSYEDWIDDPGGGGAIGGGNGMGGGGGGGGYWVSTTTTMTTETYVPGRETSLSPNNPGHWEVSSATITSYSFMQSDGGTDTGAYDQGGGNPIHPENVVLNFTNDYDKDYAKKNGWNVLDATDLKSGVAALRKYKAQGNKIRNLVVHSHGGGGRQLHLGDGQRNSFDVSYYKWKRKKNQDVKLMDDLLAEVEPGANVVFTGCNAALKLGPVMASHIRIDITVYMNYALTHGPISADGLTNSFYFNTPAIGGAWLNLQNSTSIPVLKITPAGIELK